MILGDDDPVVIQRHVWIDGDGVRHVGDASFEVSVRRPEWFEVCIGGMDYYASRAALDVGEAVRLRDVLDGWLGGR